MQGVPPPHRRGRSRRQLRRGAGGIDTTASKLEKTCSRLRADGRQGLRSPWPSQADPASVKTVRCAERRRAKMRGNQLGRCGSTATPRRAPEAERGHGRPLPDVHATTNPLWDNSEHAGGRTTSLAAPWLTSERRLWWWGDERHTKRQHRAPRTCGCTCDATNRTALAANLVGRRACGWGVRREGLESESILLQTTSPCRTRADGAVPPLQSRMAQARTRRCCPPLTSIKGA